MKNILRYLFVALMAMFIGNAFGQGTTFDFDNDYAKLFPTLTGTSANNSHDGDFTAATTSTAVDGFTVTVSAADEGVTNANRIWSSAPRLRMYSGTFTVKGNGIKKIEFTHKDGNFNFTTETGKLEGKIWTGEANEVVFKCSKNTQINKIVINGDGGSETPTEPEHTNVTIADLAGATAKIANVNLTMTDAKVLYANGARVYVREGDKAILFYSLNIDNLKTNAIIKGSIKGKLDIYNNLNEFCKTEYTKTDGLTITQSETAAEPLTIDMADAKNYISNLVKFKNVTFTDIDGKNATAHMGDKTLTVYDQFGEFPKSMEGAFDMTGVITVYKEKVQIYPISLTEASGSEETTGQVWDFTKWSDATVANLKADAAASKTAGWSDVEKKDVAEADGEPTETSKDNCFWSVAEPNADGTLSANGVVIEELKGLVWNSTYSTARSLAIAVNYPVALSEYAGGAYLWLGGGKKKIPCFTIPDVKAGSTITMEVESHKTSEGRGVELYTGLDADNLVDAATKIGDTFAPKTKEAHSWTIDKDCDVIVYNTNGCHIYKIEITAGTTAIKALKTAKIGDGYIFNLAGQRVDANYKGVVIKDGQKLIQK